MTNNHLHIVSHFNPRPFDYEGGGDLYWMTKALASAGINIYLHLYTDKEDVHVNLIEHCVEVFFYKRNIGHKGISIGIPYSVSSHADKSLIINLERDLYPILFEGIQSSFFLNQGYFNNRKTLVRLQCSQKIYFQELLEIIPRSFNKLRISIEGNQCGIYEMKIIKSNESNTISEITSDELAGSTNQIVNSIIPQFIGMPTPFSIEGQGSFCLFHGRLSEKATEHAALWLLNNVFNTLELPLVIAGENPSTQLEEAAHKHLHTCLVANPSEKEMVELIKKAQLNILPSFVSHGADNAILHSTMIGRHILTNKKGNTLEALDGIIHFAEEPSEYIKKIIELFEKPFKKEEIEMRESYLNSHFNDLKSAKALIKLLY